MGTEHPTFIAESNQKSIKNIQNKMLRNILAMASPMQKEGHIKSFISCKY